MNIVASAVPGEESTGVLVVPSEKAVFVVTSPDNHIVDRILDSLIVVPEGYVSIPFDPNGPLENSITRMTNAGLDVKTVERPRKGWSSGSLRRARPALGSVVPVGSTVTLVTT